MTVRMRRDSMIDYTNITFDENWVYADAYDHDFNARGRVKINRHTDEFYTDCTQDNFFKKGMIRVRNDVNKGKLGQKSKRTVCWC